jgi:hypothetical protein
MTGRSGVSARWCPRRRESRRAREVRTAPKWKMVVDWEGLTMGGGEGDGDSGVRWRKNREGSGDFGV